MQLLLNTVVIVIEMITSVLLLLQIYLNLLKIISNAIAIIDVPAVFKVKCKILLCQTRIQI